jgi:hypothetical protein
MNGCLVFSKEMKAGMLDVSFLPPAMYQLILTSDTRIFTAVLIKE